MTRANVFLNVPFEAKGRYRNLFVAYATGLAGLGFRPRSVLEIPPTRSRLDRLREMIARCPSSVHDLSRVQATHGCPRFNMPFELGLVAAKKGHDWFVFESEPFRLQRTLSDINGHDPLIHRGHPRVVLSKLRDVFGNRKRRTSLEELEALMKDVMKLVKLIERDHGSLIGRYPFEELVIGAQRMAERRGLI